MVQGLAAYYGGKPGEIDSEYGDKTVAAIKFMKRTVGAVVDGEFGPETAAKAAPWLMVTVPEDPEITANENTYI